MARPLADLTLDLASLRTTYASGVSPEAVLDEVFARIEECGDPGIFISLAEQDALRSAARALGGKSDGRPLWGVPFAVKDNIDVAGLETTCSCPGFAYRAAEDAVAVARLKAAGGIAVGKTNLDQFATGLVGLRTPYPVPRNAVDPALVPGGSSSGSAVAVARGLVAFALGTDTAGSGRVPAGLNNIVGLKPTLGAIPTKGVVPACKTIDCVSVFALSVDDAYAVFSAMAGFEQADPFSRAFRTAPLGPPPPRFRVGVPTPSTRSFGGDPAAEAAYEATLADVQALGGELVELDFEPFFAVAGLLYSGPFVAERYEALRRFIETSPDEIHPVTRLIIEGARRFDAGQAFGGLYELAAMKRALSIPLGLVDCLLVPTYPRPRTAAEVLEHPVGLNSEFGTYTNFVNLMDLCALAVPGRPRPDGLPAGVTLIAQAGADARIAVIGERLHEMGGTPLGALGLPAPAAPERAPRPAPDEIEIVVVGAHLSGMALNGELTRLGARFLRIADTADCYRLYALPGKVARPGLVRVGDGAGAAIATEVWALPSDKFGPFVAGVPAPLGVGTLRLADGSTALGFLAEAVATADAEDITRFGGWRAYQRARAAA
ncbi:allophanate hydrolase [Chelatococcus sambhunathii]|uniref:Allophanate hydrolase n=1 Tax=Chelatococcus sambhunathii TaxID=363953 RepID=A0ABU1DDA6_9HYPH|nr:allophanate hydrolase [Chelatococcus sambhunathii]MDR4306028.1 allophanate hydrolase [Chelatococcus sambhunathii]